MRRQAAFSLIVLGLFGACAPFPKATIDESAGPTTVNEAQSHVSIRLPSSAKNVQYAYYSEWIAVIELIMFEAPVEDCSALAEEIVAAHNAKHPDSNIPGLRPMSADISPITNRHPLKAKWFDPLSIQHGLIAGANESHTPAIWIDSDKGVFYYQYTD